MIRWQRLGVAFGLALRLHHRLRPTWGVALGGAPLEARGCGLAEQIEIVLATLGSGAIGLTSLLRFEDERAPLVAVDPTEIARAVAVLLKHTTLKDIAVLGIVGTAALRRLDPYQLA
nr:hypothetical protein [uncultured Sphingomonas sp.]